jgi:hypothetical protein
VVAAGLTALAAAAALVGAPLVLLLLGWPLAVPVITVAGLATLLTGDGSLAHALSLTVWAGLAPATAVLLLGHLRAQGVRPEPVAFLLGRAFLVPMLTLAPAASARRLQPWPARADGRTAARRRVLLAMGEARGPAPWSACWWPAGRSGWPPWSDRMYLGRPARHACRARIPPSPLSRVFTPAT